MLKVQGVEHYYGASHTLWDINIEIPKGGCVCLMGRNGVGKTTLLKCMNKILEPKQGTILLDGQAVKNMSRLEVAKHIGYVPQSSVDNPEGLPVFEIVLMGRRPHMLRGARSRGGC